MFRRLKALLIGIAGLFIVSTGVGLSFWAFGTNAYRDINSGVDVDDIYENYNVGKPNQVPQYDMFVFPSAHYLSRYGDTGKYGGDYNPEDLYGYMEVKIELDNLGNPVIKETYKPGKRFENVSDVKQLALEYCHDIDSADYYDNSSNKNDTFIPLRNNSMQFGYEGFHKGVTNNSFRQNTNFQDPGIYSVGENGTENPSNKSDLNDKECDIDYNGQKYTDLSNVPDGCFKEEAKPYYQTLNVDDRLGYWYEKNAEDGRFLPIKYSFSGSISPDVFTYIVPNPRTDISDANGWHNFKFSNWVYCIDPKDKTYEIPRDAFSNYDKKNVFNVLNDLQTMAVKENGRHVIRLFPTFSNGKDYPPAAGGSNPFDTKTDEELGYGYRDGIKVDYKTKNKNNSNEVSYNTRYFTFSSGAEQTFIVNDNGQNTKFNYSVVNNFNINSQNDTISYIDFSSTMISYFRDRWLGGSYDKDYSNWTNDSVNPLELKFTFNNTNNTELFSSGDKNVYCFSTRTHYKSESDAINAINSLITNLEEHNQQTSDVNYTGKHNDLKGRALVPISNDGTNKPTIIITRSVKQSSDGIFSQHYWYHAYCFFYERILDFKVITDIPIKKDSVGQSITNPDLNVYEEESDGILLDHYLENYDRSRNMVYESANYYKGKRVGNKFIPDLVDGKPSRENEANRFIYKIDLLDLKNVKHLFFGIRLAKEDLGFDINFNLEPLNDGASGTENERYLFETLGLIDETSKEAEVKYESSLFSNAGEYFENVMFRDWEGKEFEGFKVKDMQAGQGQPNGLYSIVLVFAPKPNIPFNFDVYTYKSSDLFVKIFDEEPSKYGAGHEQEGFINHSSGIYYERKYDTGMYVKRDHEFKNNTTGEVLKLTDLFKKMCEVRESDTSNKPNYKDSTHVYYLIDSVTRVIVAKADLSDPQNVKITVTTDSILMVTENHVLYILSHDAYANDDSNPLNPHKHKN